MEASLSTGPGGWDQGQQVRDSLFSISGQGRLLQAHTLLYRPGMQIVLWQQKEKRVQNLSFEIHKPHLELELQIEGRANHSLIGKSGPVLTHSRPGQWAFNSFEECDGRISYSPSESGLCLSILLEPGILAQDSGKIAQLLLPVLGNDFIRSPAEPMFESGQMSPAMLAATNQLLNCPYTGLVRELFLEAKVMELIAIQISLLTRDEEAEKQRRLSRDELMAIRKARETLLADLNHPPGLEELAHQVGLNRNKLNQGFRQLYGATAFELLRAERLKKARGYLQNSRMSLAEIAQAAGYCAQSHFTSAFTAQFGVSPGRFRKKIRPLDPPEM